MSNKMYEVTGHYKKARAVVLDSFSTRPEALAFARNAVDEIEPAPGDSLVSVTVTDKATNKVLNTFYPDFYEAETLDDDDDG